MPFYISFYLENNMDETSYDYSKLDQPEVLQAIFYPRPEAENVLPPPDAVDNTIPVGEGIQVHARFHLAGKEDPNILFFHGNGEIVSDYDTIGPFYTKYGMNFLADCQHHAAGFTFCFYDSKNLACCG